MSQHTTAATDIREYVVAPATPTPTAEATVVADVGNARTAIMVQIAGKDHVVRPGPPGGGFDPGLVAGLWVAAADVLPDGERPAVALLGDDGDPFPHLVVVHGGQRHPA